MTPQNFELIKTKYQFWSSWAVWTERGDNPKSNIGDLSILDPKLNPLIRSNTRIKLKLSLG